MRPNAIVQIEIISSPKASRDTSQVRMTKMRILHLPKYGKERLK